jgi:hypothetical protein
MRAAPGSHDPRDRPDEENPETVETVRGVRLKPKKALLDGSHML